MIEESDLYKQHHAPLLEYRNRISELDVGNVSATAVNLLARRIALATQFPHGLKHPLLAQSDSRAESMDGLLAKAVIGCQLAYHADRHRTVDPRQMLYFSEEWGLQQFFSEIGNELDGPLQGASQEAYLYAFAHTAFSLGELRKMGTVSLLEVALCPVLDKYPELLRKKTNWHTLEGYGDIFEACIRLRSITEASLRDVRPVNPERMFEALHFFNMSYILNKRFSKDFLGTRNNRKD